MTPDYDDRDDPVEAALDDIQSLLTYVGQDYNEIRLILVALFVAGRRKDV